jgi:aminobenzoyl-glutamate utilization protein B
MRAAVIVLALAVLIPGTITRAAGAQEKAEVSKEKKLVLDWLSQPLIMEKFGTISDSIWSFAELGMQEFKSSKLLADTLEEAGFTVEMGAAGMPTCFVASYGSGKPVIGILGEYDALPMISQKGRVPTQDPVVDGAPGHGCGHNLMGTAATAAAIAVKQAMEKHNLPGTIKVFGSPAEETLISRPYMVKAGLFEGVDAVIDNHSSSSLATGYGRGGNAMYSVIFSFKGITAHGAGAPWTARSALDAVELTNIAANFLREHLFYTYRMHYVIIHGGEAPNVVPDRASVWYYIRNTDERVEDMYERVVNCAKGAALASGTELTDVRILSAIHQRNANKRLAELMFKNIEIVGMPEWTEEEHAFARSLQKELGRAESGMPTKYRPLRGPSPVFTGGGSSDVGEVTRVVPTTSLAFPGQVPGNIGHHWSCVAANYGSAAWKGLNAGAKVMAATAIDLFQKPEELEAMWEEFKAYEEKHPYKSFLPEDAQPPLDLNQELMEKFRARMELVEKETIK